MKKAVTLEKNDGYRQVVVRLMNLLAYEDTVLVGIDGATGSGKSFLVEALCRKLPCVPVHLGELPISAEEKPGYIRQRIIEPYHKMTGQKRIILVEGLYSCHPDIAGFYDLTVCVSSSPEGEELREEERQYLEGYDIPDSCDIVINLFGGKEDD